MLFLSNLLRDTLQHPVQLKEIILQTLCIIFNIAMYLHRSIIQKFLLMFESCRKTLFLSQRNWCTFLTALKYFNGNLTSKYVYSASHMTGGLEEKLGNLREGKKKKTLTVEVTSQIFWVTLPYWYLCYSFISFYFFFSF